MSGLIYKKMNDVMKDIRAIGKDQKNTAQGFKFRGIDQFVNGLYPALCKNGVFVTTEVLDKQEIIKEVERSSGKKGIDKHVSLTMKYTFHAEDGSSVSSSIAAEGLDSGDKATNKALSAALKYALIQTFSIPTQDMEEADLVTPELGTPLASVTTIRPVQSQQINQQTANQTLIDNELQHAINSHPVQADSNTRVSFRKPKQTTEPKSGWGK